MEPVADPLAQLRDIYLPAEPSLWPPAPGWWILAVLVVIALVIAVRIVRRVIAKSRPRRVLISRLKNLDIEAKIMSEKLEKIRTMSRLIRQYSIYRYGRENVARLHGSEWLQFLERSVSDNFKFMQSTCDALGTEQFTPSTDADLNILQKNLIAWARKS